MSTNQSPTPRTARIVLAATILGSSMAFLDGTVVNLALPTLQKDYRVDVPVVQWVVEAYALTLASLLLVGGSLGDHYGRRKVYIWGILLFASSSMACGFAPNTEWLIVARTIQGAGAALLVPGSLALITAVFPESERGRAIGTWSGFSAITTAVGPIAGGWLIEHFSWRWVFCLNLPLALIVIYLCASISEVRVEEAAGRIDWLGAGLTTLGLASLTYALIEWPSVDRHTPLALVAIGGLLALAGLGLAERRAESPMIPFDLFRSTDFIGANVVTFFVYAPLGALLFFFPLDLIQIQHYSTTKAGAAFSPFVMVMLVLSRWAGRLVDRCGARLPLTVGPLLTTVGYAVFAWAPQDGHYWRSFLPPVLLTSLGMAITVAPLTTTVMNAVPKSGAGIASGINNAVSRLASLIAVAAFGALLVAIFTHALDHKLALLRMPSGEAAQIQASRLQLAAIKVSDTRAARAITESFVQAYRTVMWIAACSTFAGAFGGWFLLRPNHARSRLVPI